MAGINLVKSLRDSILPGVLIALAVFSVELRTPLGIPALYVAAILASLLSRNAKIIYSILIFCTGLTIIGMFYPPRSVELWDAIINRIVGGIAFWATGLIGLKRLEAEGRLRESETLRRNVLDHMLEGAQIIGFDWRYLYVNETVAAQGHQTREGLIGRTMLEVYPGIEDTDLFVSLRDCMQGRVSRQMQNEFVYPDGGRGWFELSIQPVPEGLFILSYDITERKQVEAELHRVNSVLEQRVEERAASLKTALRYTQALYDVVQAVISFDKLPDILKSIVQTAAQTLSANRATIITFDQEARSIIHMVWAGPGSEHIASSVPYDELMDGLSGWVLRELRPAYSTKEEPDPRESATVQKRRRETDCGCIVVYPLLYLGKALGTMTIINASEQPDFSEWEVSWMALIADQAASAIGRAQLYDQLKQTNLHLELQGQDLQKELAGHKITEEALRQSEERYRLLAWATTDAVWDWDLQLNQIHWGMGLQKIFHYAPENIQANPGWWFGHIHPEDRAKVERSINQALDGGLEFWSKEYRFRRNDGTYADILDRGYILRNETGAPYRILGSLIDITEHKKADATIRHQYEMLARLHQITLELLEYREVGSLLQTIVNLASDFLDAPYVEIILVEKDELVVRSATANVSHLIGERVKRNEARLSWRAFDSRQPVTLDDYSMWPDRRNIYDATPLHAVAELPILNSEQCLGILSFGRDQPGYTFTHDQIQHGLLLSNLTALVLQNAGLRDALREQSIRDPLTGLFNRRYMEETVKREASRVTRHLHQLGIIMLDIDHFKKFNDSHGHAAGDALLRTVGRFLQGQIRTEDVACRYGGEEFILIMPDITLEVVLERAGQIREAAVELRLNDNDQHFGGITISLGLAIYPQHGKTIDAVIRAADAALYRAKQTGRNRVVVAEDAR